MYFLRSFYQHIIHVYGLLVMSHNSHMSVFVFAFVFYPGWIILKVVPWKSSLLIQVSHWSFLLIIFFILVIVFIIAGISICLLFVILGQTSDFAYELFLGFHLIFLSAFFFFSASLNCSLPELLLGNCFGFSISHFINLNLLRSHCWVIKVVLGSWI